MRGLPPRGAPCVLAVSAVSLAALSARELEAAVGGCTVSCANGITCGSARCIRAQLRPNTPG